MAQVCGIYDTRLTIAHQRRFSDSVREAKRLLEAGEVTLELSDDRPPHPSEQREL